MTSSTMTADLTHTDHVRVIPRRDGRLRQRPPFGLSTSVWAFVRTFVAASLSCLAVYIAAEFAINWQPAAWDMADRLALVAKGAALAVSPALAAIALVAAQRLNARYFSDGQVKPKSALDINSRFIQNTYEQFLVFFAGIGALSLYLVPADAKAIPVLSIMFFAGRLIYWLGYHRNPYLRSYGFGITFYPTVAVFAWLALHVTTGIYINI